TLTLDPAAQGTMTLVAKRFGPLVSADGTALVDGDTYTLQALNGNPASNEWQIMGPAAGGGLGPFVPDLTAWDPSASHEVQGGVLPISLSTGTQSLYIDLSSAPDQTDQLTIAPGSVGLSTLGAPTATGVSTATTEGGGGGVGEFAFPTSSLTAQPVVL